MNDETIVDEAPDPDQIPGANRPRWIHPREVTKLIKRALAAAFPQTGFSVRYRPFGYTTVEWIDGADAGQVLEVVKQFNGAEFDGATDSWRFRPTQVNGELVQYGIHAVYCERLTKRQIHKPKRRARLAKDKRS